MDVLAYHDATGAQHQAHFDQLRPAGFRPITLSVYQPGDPRYAAVWVRRDGPDWSAVHGVDAAGYQAAFDTAAAAGYHPTILTVAGSAANPVFAGVFEQRPGGVPLTRFGLTSGDPADPGTIQHWDSQAHANGWIMTGGAIYGDPGSPRYAGIWPVNTRRLAWSADGIADSSQDYQHRFDAQVSGWARASFVTLNADERYLSLFVDDQIGPWFGRHGMTSAGYQAEFDRLVALGFVPICVQGGGSGAAVRFAAIFARQDSPLARQWTSVGVGTANQLDALMRTTIEEAGVRGAALAVVQNTRLVFTRGYTNAEPGYPTVLPTTPFRLASVSKTFTGIAIHQLIAEGQLALADTVQSVLGLTKPDGSALPPGFDVITIEDLLVHRSTVRPDYMWADLATAQAFGTTLPVSEAQVASYWTSLGLVAPAPDYNNFGYELLGMVVARKRGVAGLMDAISASILKPLHMTRTRSATSLVGQAFSDEARYHRTSEKALSLPLFPSVMAQDQPLVPDVYGNFHLENQQGSGGLTSAVVDLARFIAALNLNDRNPILSRAALLSLLDKAVHSGRPRAGHGFDSVTFDGTTYTAGKGGYLWTSQNTLNFTLDGVGMALCYDGVNDDVLFHERWPDIQTAVWSHGWPTHGDHFPDYGMPALSAHVP